MCAPGFVIPSRLPARFALVAGTLLCAVMGCQQSQQRASEATTETPAQQGLAWQEQPLGGVAAGPAAPVAVKQGPAPLLYLAEMPQTIRVVDETANQVIGEIAVERRSIVRIDRRTGVIAGSETLLAGPLPAGRRYGIYLVPDRQNYSRTGRYQPRPRQAPAE